MERGLGLYRESCFQNTVIGTAQMSEQLSHFGSSCLFAPALQKTIEQGTHCLSLLKNCKSTLNVFIKPVNAYSYFKLEHIKVSFSSVSALKGKFSNL